MLWTVLPRLWLVCAQYVSIAFSQLCCLVLSGLNAFTPVSVQLCMRAPSDSPCLFALLVAACRMRRACRASIHEYATPGLRVRLLCSFACCQCRHAVPSAITLPSIDRLLTTLEGCFPIMLPAQGCQI